jgi:hypothetical protein
MTNIKRIGTPDLLKGLAVIFMIQVHLMELFAQQDLYDSLIGKISLFLGGVPAAPVFMIVMGYFVAYSNKGPVYLINRGIKLFIAGIILNIGLNFHLIYNILFNGWQINVWQYIFGVDILHLAGMSLITIALLSIVLKKNSSYYFLAAIVIAVLSTFINRDEPVTGFISYLKAFITGGQEWSYFPLIPWLAYPLTGYAFRLFEMTYKERITVKNKLILTGVFGVLFIFTAGYATEVSHNLKEYYTHGIVFFFWALSFIILLASSLSLVDAEAGETVFLKYVKWLGKNVTVIYIIQWLLIGNIATSIYKTQSLAEIIVWFVGITLLTSILTLLWNRFRKSYNLEYLKL